MYPKTVIEYNNFGRKTALATFLTGGFIVALYYFTAFSGMIFISLFFIISFFLLNTIVSISLISLRSYLLPGFVGSGQVFQLSL